MYGNKASKGQTPRGMYIRESKAVRDPSPFESVWSTSMRVKTEYRCFQTFPETHSNLQTTIFQLSWSVHG